MFEFTTIIKKIYKRFTLLDTSLILFTSVLYFVTRLYRIEALPVFSDEGIYINWAKIAAFSPADRLISLTDGKQPLQTFLMLPFVRFLQDDLLLAGRLASVFAGFFAFLGLIFLVRILFGIKASHFASLIYLLTPMFFLYDRLALVESALNASLIWSLLFIVLLGKSHRLDIAFMAGISFGIALLAKSSALMYLMLFSAGFLFSRKKIFLRSRHFFQKQNLTYIINYLILFVIALVGGFLISQIQRFSPHYYMIAQKNLTFILTANEFLQNPFHLLGVNWYLIPYYLFSESSYIMPILAVLGFILLCKKDYYYALFFGIILFVPYLVIGSFNKVLFPRYLIFFPSILSILASYFLVQMLHQKKILILSISLLAFVLTGTYSIYNYYYNPRQIILPAIDKGQYVSGATAVWGAKEILEQAQNLSKNQKITILAEGNFGLVADALRAHEKASYPNVKIHGVWPLNLEDAVKAQELLTDEKVWIVFSHRQTFTPDWPIKLIKSYPKPGGELKLYLFELLPKGQFPDSSQITDL